MRSLELTVPHTDHHHYIEIFLTWYASHPSLSNVCINCIEYSLECFKCWFLICIRFLKISTFYLSNNVIKYKFPILKLVTQLKVAVSSRVRRLLSKYCFPSKIWMQWPVLTFSFFSSSAFFFSFTYFCFCPKFLRSFRSAK